MHGPICFDWAGSAGFYPGPQPWRALILPGFPNGRIASAQAAFRPARFGVFPHRAVAPAVLRFLTRTIFS